MITGNQAKPGEKKDLTTMQKSFQKHKRKLLILHDTSTFDR